MDLSNLKPAVGSKHSDSFRRGRGHASGNGKTAGKGLMRTMLTETSTPGIDLVCKRKISLSSF